jgi:hypothetical protein
MNKYGVQNNRWVLKFARKESQSTPSNEKLYDVYHRWKDVRLI